MTMRDASWPDGPWKDEPDRLEWRHRGVPCLANRGPLGAWCGYVAVEPGHPWHGTEPDACVHGGITYGSECSKHVCHVPLPGEPDNVWWVGFDCGHCDDLTPGLAALDCGPLGGVYRDLAYVKRECEDLADQLIAARLSSPGKPHHGPNRDDDREHVEDEADKPFLDVVCDHDQDHHGQ